MSFVFPVVGANEWSGGSYMPLSHRGRSHYAIDIYADQGSIIVAPIGGRISMVGLSTIGGHTVTIQGDDGNSYYFAHMAESASVKAGDTIKGGAMIGYVGNSGSASSTSYHLHFSVKDDRGNVVNPIDMLNNAIVVPDIEPWGTLEDLPWGEVGERGARNEYDEWMRKIEDASKPPVQPAWIDQLNQARQDRLNRPGEEPQKVQAAEIVRGTLRGMSRMVRQQGFQSSQPDEDQNVIEREAGTRGVGTR